MSSQLSFLPAAGCSCLSALVEKPLQRLLGNAGVGLWSEFSNVRGCNAGRKDDCGELPLSFLHLAAVRAVNTCTERHLRGTLKASLMRLPIKCDYVKWAQGRTPADIWAAIISKKKKKIPSLHTLSDASIPVKHNQKVTHKREKQPEWNCRLTRTFTHTHTHEDKERDRKSETSEGFEERQHTPAGEVTVQSLSSKRHGFCSHVCVCVLCLCWHC